MPGSFASSGLRSAGFAPRFFAANSRSEASSLPSPPTPSRTWRLSTICPARGEVTTAGASIIAYGKWRDTGDAGILAEIEDYNRIDCVSTERMRDWLLEIRPKGPWLEIGEGETERSMEQQSENEELSDLLSASGLPEERRRVLYDLGVFHWRENKPQAWSVFASAAKDFEDLCDDMECLAGLVAAGEQYPVKRSIGREYGAYRLE